MSCIATSFNTLDAFLKGIIDEPAEYVRCDKAIFINTVGLAAYIMEYAQLIIGGLAIINRAKMLYVVCLF